MKRGINYDVIVIGAGHAGCEAALATARMGLGTVIFSMNLDTIGQMSCNPAVGGLAKSHLVKEIDVLGGEMAKVTDRAGIQFKILNRSKGPAVWATRVQADRALYRKYMRESLEEQENLEIKGERIEEILAEGDRVCGVRTSERVYTAKAVIVATGTFLNGMIHIGMESFPAGRAGEPPSTGLSESLRYMGLEIGRLKTGTPPRLDAGSIDFSGMEVQEGDVPPPAMSLFTKEIKNPQLPCYITYTNERTHKIIHDNLRYSPLYSGKIIGIGPRYCPSIEDKIIKFSGKKRHQIFLEPEGIDTDEYYANGISTSLPHDIQVKLARSIPGLEEVVIKKPGYAIEYDFVYPTQLKPTLETKSTQGLFLAGQINGTSGYEEAAAQGLMAGINAALKIKGGKPLILGRHEAYIGVLIDDLVTKGTEEPYRMFTSRAEYRLLLRQDNADIRLMEAGYRLGLINGKQYNMLLRKDSFVAAEIQRLQSTRMAFSPPERAVPREAGEQVEIRTKYEGYIRRQAEQAERFKKTEDKKIPEDFPYSNINGLSKEIVEKLEGVKPLNLGQAGRIPGVTPAAVSLLIVALERHRRTSDKSQVPGLPAGRQGRKTPITK
jgi:tRNA uridine 5-carboxymethylaminomethyl modification enzyme